jgi:predicted cupin superfamily sugar epimerase
MDDAERIIEKLGLAAHPEGGWYRQTWVAAGPGRASGTSILFLLKAGERSHWHRVDADEIWHFHAGGPLLLEMSPTAAGPVQAIRLGPDVLAGDAPQGIVPAGWWQAAHPLSGLSVRRVRAGPRGFRHSAVLSGWPRKFALVPSRRLG